MDFMRFGKSPPPEAVKGARAALDQANEFLARSRKIAAKLKEDESLSAEERVTLDKQARDYAEQAGHLAKLAETLAR